MEQQGKDQVNEGVKTFRKESLKKTIPVEKTFSPTQAGMCFMYHVISVNDNILM